jgi:hypothetical protein
MVAIIHGYRYLGDVENRRLSTYGRSGKTAKICTISVRKEKDVAMHEFLDLLKDYPSLATFFGAVATSFSALAALLGVIVGITLTNRGNNKRLEKQLSHERELRKKEREMSLRKDIYLVAVEAISTGITSIGQFANMEIPNDKLTEAYIEKFPSIAKVHVIAGEETIKALAPLLSELDAAYLQLLAKRIPLALQKNQITILERQRENFGKERDRMNDLMKQHVLNGVFEPRLWENIQKLYESEKIGFDETVKQHSEITADLFTKQSAYATECMAETARLNQLVVPVLVAARRELELPISEHIYMQFFEQGSRTGEDHLREFFQSVQRLATHQPS